MMTIRLEPGSINCTCCQDIPWCRNVTKEETDPIVDAVCAKLQSRSAVGVKKYGKTLAGNPSTVKEKLTHIQEELMDAANYVEWLLQEKEMTTPTTVEIEAATRQAVLNEMRMVEEMGEKADLKIHGCVAVNHWHTFKRALQSPRVPVIPGLDEAIMYVRNIAISADEGSEKIFTVVKAAAEYAELQKGV